jgi:general secretion pathway protein J
MMYSATGFKKGREPDMRCYRYDDGFTLLEVLVALTLCAVITLLAYQSLQTASDSAARSEQTLALVQKLDYTWRMLERDLQQAVSIPVIDTSENMAAEDKLAESMTFWGRQPIAPPIEANRQHLISLSRQGWRNPLQRQRSELQRVSYLLQGDQLYRHMQALEKISTTSAGGQQQALIDDIESLSIAFLPAASKNLQADAWLEQWPQVSGLKDGGLPLAVKVDISHNGLGQVSRMFYLPAATQ